MKVAGPKHYDRIHEIIFCGRRSTHKVNWDGKKALAYVVSKHVVGSVLDLGCGFGLLSGFVDGRYLGIDFSEYAIRKARKLTGNPHAEFITGDIRALPETGQFDTVVMLEVLEHLADRVGAVEIAKRLAVQRVIVSVPRGRSRSGDHVWNDIRREDVTGLLGLGTECWKYRRKWLAIWKVSES